VSEAAYARAVPRWFGALSIASLIGCLLGCPTTEPEPEPSAPAAEQSVPSPIRSLPDLRLAELDGVPFDPGLLAPPTKVIYITTSAIVIHDEALIRLESGRWLRSAEDPSIAGVGILGLVEFAIVIAEQVGAGFIPTPRRLRTTPAVIVADRETPIATIIDVIEAIDRSNHHLAGFVVAPTSDAPTRWIPITGMPDPEGRRPELVLHVELRADSYMLWMAGKHAGYPLSELAPIQAAAGTEPHDSKRLSGTVISASDSVPLREVLSVAEAVRVGGSAVLIYRGHLADPEPVPEPPKFTGSAKLGRIAVDGAIDEYRLVEVLELEKQTIARCFERMEIDEIASEPNWVTIDLVISETGSITGVELFDPGASFPGRAIKQCMIRAALRWRLPSPESGQVTVEVPIDLVLTPVRK
jgi:hypothetical protein